QRERASVTTSTDQVIGKQAADAGVERAKIELIAPMLALTNGQVYGLIVSTNFVSGGGFNPNPAPNANLFTNVNYFYADGNPLSEADRLRMLSTLLYNPRPPVFVTNRFTGRTEFRYYLDLNRNGVFDPNGLQPVFGTNGNPVLVGPSEVLTNFFVGDPEWIGVLERPDQPHSPSNRFVARYAYLVVPAGKTLDINFIHNQAKLLPAGPFNRDGFLRNQGVGSYEINLGAFLTDLNPNLWNPISPNNVYDYRTNATELSRGAGFDDALALLRYRYGYGPLQPARFYFRDNASALQRDGIDQYSDGDLLLARQIPRESALTGDNVVEKPWAGADQPNAYFTIQEFFDYRKTRPEPDNYTVNFTNRLLRAGTNISSFDRYTYYRMLEQLGTDSEPDRRMNLNYVNVDETMRVIPGLETQLRPWIPVQFFTNAAERLLRAQYQSGYLGIRNISVTNIPVVISNRFVYSPGINRMLQMAANLYEATITNSRYPRLFRPYFSRVQTTNGFNDFYIRGFEEVTDVIYRDSGNEFLTIPIDLQGLSPDPLPNIIRPNVHGVPWIIGARKGLPNFNEVTLSSRMHLTRRLQASRTSRDAQPSTYTFQEQYIMDLWCELGVEAWNSYHGSNYPGASIYVDGVFNYGLTNNAPARFSPSGGVPVQYKVAVTTNNWPGYAPTYNPAGLPVPGSFIVPLRTNFIVVSNMVYNPNNRTFHGNLDEFYPLRPDSPQWGLDITNRLRVIITDATQRIIDYVQLRGPSAYRPLSEEIRTTGRDFEGLWNTNRAANVSGPERSQGHNYQLRISQGQPVSTDTEWRSFGPNEFVGGSRANEIAKFKAFMLGASATFEGIPAQNPTNLVMQAPFTPTRAIAQTITWQANDPLVHYLEQDLVDLAGSITNSIIKPPSAATNLLENIGQLNDRYGPWGGNPKKFLGDSDMAAADPLANNFTVKDPGLLASTLWDFPTNKLPNIGWMGRIHRGTPWQTVYLKSYDILRTNGWGFDLQGVVNWSRWSGHALVEDATNSAPVNDRMLFDMFTVAPNENAGRGRLPINQTNLAAWSAVLSGVHVLSNDLNGVSHPFVIQPAAVAPELGIIVDGIVRSKSALITNGTVFFPLHQNGEYSRLADILAVPQLSDGSPYINTNALRQTSAGGLNDMIIERIPQQIMSLLGHPRSPRFVVYSYGQALRPADQSIVRSFGSSMGLATNYQVTAESAVRVVMRVDGSFDPRDADHPDPERRYPPRVVMEHYNPLPAD
ncbi:MAG TPA: hypothetical protein VEH04_10110, partial [Verrucomicrobiae bacterium]|nr:hypothetical protein [Verrucomicrobiae bacterium]